MAQKRRAESPTRHPLIEKVLASRPAVAELIGFNVEEISDGHAVGSLQAGPQHANPMGTMHGGVLCDLADAAMGMAFASTLAPREHCHVVPSLYREFLHPNHAHRDLTDVGTGPHEEFRNILQETARTKQL